MTSDLDARIRTELAGERLTPRERDAVWQRVDDELDRPAARIRRRSTLPTRTLLAAALIVLTLGGIALAADGRVVHRIFGEDEPITTQVDQFANPSARRATDLEYARLVEMAGHGAGSQIVPIDQTRVLADDPRVGRLVVAPVGFPTAGPGACQLYTPPGVTLETMGRSKDDALSGWCGPDTFDRLGIDIIRSAGSCDEGPRCQVWSISGKASDDVDRIEVGLADGTREPVALVDNVLHWQTTDPSRQAVSIETWRGDRHESRPIDEARAVSHRAEG